MNRRSFLKSIGLLSASGAVQSMAINLAGMSQAVAKDNLDSDYKALVCIFLLGGNDHANTMIPIDAINFAKYKQHRGDIALNKAKILPLNPQLALDKPTQYGLHPQLKGIHDLFQQGNLGVVQNLGTLLAPISKAEYFTNQRVAPAKLFSHNDQQAIWQTSQLEGKGEGWGAKMGELTLPSDQNKLFTAINLGRRSYFLSSKHLQQYNMSVDGATAINGVKVGSKVYGSTKISDNIRNMLTRTRENIYEQEISETIKQSLQAEKQINQSFANLTDLKTKFSEDELSVQLKMVAKMIQARQQLGMKRQVFMVVLNGFDTHDDLLERHDELMKKLNAGMTSFYKATEELGVQNQVTSFTMSDFGRTFSTNGDGSDHGWGGHHFVMGGAVKGRNIYGNTPTYGVNTNDDVGRGRLIPTTSVDQYSATLAKWFGVPEAYMSRIAPNLDNFDKKYLAFI